jgi:hypothetical protein
MTKKELKKKEALIEITNKLDSGMSREKILEELSTKYYGKDSIAKLIAMTPDNQTKKKYKWLNNVLLGLLGITIILKIIAGIFLLANVSLYAIPFAFLLPIINFLLAVEVSKYRGYIYNILGVLTIAGMLQSIPKYTEFRTFELIDKLIFISITGISLYLAKNMFPNYGFFGPKKDKQGNIQLS